MFVLYYFFAFRLWSSRAEIHVEAAAAVVVTIQVVRDFITIQPWMGKRHNIILYYSIIYAWEAGVYYYINIVLGTYHYNTRFGGRKKPGRAEK